MDGGAAAWNCASATIQGFVALRDFLAGFSTIKVMVREMMMLMVMEMLMLPILMEMK